MANSTEENEDNNPKLPLGEVVLLGFGLFWAGVTGIFFAAPTVSVFVGMAGIAIAILYSGLVCLLRRSAVWFAIGISIVLAIAIPNQGAPIVHFIVAQTLSINFLVFGEIGIQNLKNMNRQQSFWRLATSFAGALGLGWAIAALFG